MEINKHGLKMIGLKKAAANTGCWGLCTEISYDRETGKIMCEVFADSNSYSTWDSDSIINCCCTTRHMTMQEIADEIACAVEKRKLLDRYFASLEAIAASIENKEDNDKGI